MTGNEIGEGARQHRAGKRRYWTLTLAWSGIIIAIAGAMSLFQDGVGPGSLTPGAAIGFASALAAAWIFGTVAFFRVIDEVDLQDNLVAFTVGYIANAIIVMSWLILFFGGLAGPPLAIRSLGLATLIAGVAYGWLKVRRRF